MAPYAQPILFFFCRPCGEYHEKTHRHYREMFERKEARAKAKGCQSSKAGREESQARLNRAGCERSGLSKPD